MHRNRDGLVPIGDALSGMGGPVKALREATPQALHHFTQADQVNQLVGASEADPDLGFMVRLMALCSLPRSNPGNRKEYKRANGPYTLYMTAGGGNKLPYGTLPRLLLAWVWGPSSNGTKSWCFPGSCLFLCVTALASWMLPTPRLVVLGGELGNRFGPRTHVAR